MKKDEEEVEDIDEELPSEFFDTLGYPSISGMHMIDRDMQLRPSKASICKESIGVLDIPRERGHAGSVDYYDDRLSPIDVDSDLDIHPVNENYADDFTEDNSGIEEDLDVLSEVLNSLGHVGVSRKIEAIRKYAAPMMVMPSRCVTRVQEDGVEWDECSVNPFDNIKKEFQDACIKYESTRKTLSDSRDGFSTSIQQVSPTGNSYMDMMSSLPQGGNVIHDLYSLTYEIGRGDTGWRLEPGMHSEGVNISANKDDQEPFQTYHDDDNPLTGYRDMKLWPITDWQLPDPLNQRDRGAFTDNILPTPPFDWESVDPADSYQNDYARQLAAIRASQSGRASELSEEQKFLYATILLMEQGQANWIAQIGSLTQVGNPDVSNYYAAYQNLIKVLKKANAGKKFKGCKGNQVIVPDIDQSDEAFPDVYNGRCVTVPNLSTPNFFTVEAIYADSKK